MAHLRLAVWWDSPSAFSQHSAKYLKYSEAMLAVLEDDRVRIEQRMECGGAKEEGKNSVLDIAN